MRRIKEWLSVQLAKNPGRVVLFAILLFNVLFFLLSAVVISNLSLTGTEGMSFLEAAFCTITMILDAGCIQFVISDIGNSGVVIAVVCLGIILIGMIAFTGSVIGYVTNYISNFIEHANEGNRKLRISGHMVILNWNTRASEIVNDLLYCPSRQKVAILVSGRKNEIEKEIEERLSDTISRENEAVHAEAKKLGLLRGLYHWHKNQFKRNVTVIIREGDVFSSKQLRDISLERAKTVIILGNDINDRVCKYELRENQELLSRGNSQTVKTLMQVSDITAADYSDDDQKIIVEVTDDWTLELVDKIIKCKQVEEKCNIVPVRVNKVLGQILSQFSLMPELNLAYKELFSNKGATFYLEDKKVDDDVSYTKELLRTNNHIIPLTSMESQGKWHYYYVGTSEKDIRKVCGPKQSDYSVSLNRDYWMERKNIIILGHNSKCEDIMEGFCAFRAEWNRKECDTEIMEIVVIDEERYLKKMNYYEKYPFVVKKVAANIYDRERICATIEEFVLSHEEDTSILILSDDSVINEETDANALANLIYVQDIINRKKEENPDFDPASIDVIVEIIDPKHHDIVNSYSVNNVVISNRYISKMITQIGEKEALYDFYNDILTYDTDAENGFESKEIYAKKVSRMFMEIPKKCTAEELIRAVYLASVDERIPLAKRNPTLVLGYVKADGRMVLFGGNQAAIEVELEARDKLIVFSNH